MAEQATERMVVAATPERCFAVASDIDAYPTWAGDIKEVTVHDRDSEGRPLLVTFRAAAFGRSTSYTLSYDYGDAPAVISWVQTRGDITAKLDGRYVFVGSSGDVIDTSSRTLVSYLPQLNATTEFIEIDWRDGRPLNTGARCA